MVKYRKSWEVIGVTTEGGEFFCRVCVEDMGGDIESDERPVFLSDEFRSFCDRCGVDSATLSLWTKEVLGDLIGVEE